MPRLIREVRRRARKAHRCSMCDGPIPAGDSYLVTTSVYDDRVYDWRNCQACMDDNITSVVFTWCGKPDEGIGYPDGIEWARESLTDPEQCEIAGRFLERATGGAA